MNCPRAEELLSDHRSGELHVLLRGELEAHLASCADCAALAAALDEVMGVLRAAGTRLQAPEMEPAPGLAARVAAAAWRAPRAVVGGRRWAGLPRLQTLAASVAFLAAGTALAGRMAVQHGWPQRLMERTATAGVHLIEKKDRAIEDLRVLRVVMGATFSGRMDRVNERVDDYRRLLERRRAAAPAAAPAGAGPASESPRPSSPPAAARPRPVSAAEPATWAARALPRGAGDSENRGRTGHVRQG
jgi:hypothetical protein